MQSESQAPSTAATQSSPHTARTTSQHGLHDSDTAASLHRAEHGDSIEQSALESAIAASVQGDPEESRRLRPHVRDTPSPPSYNRITEYEQAATTHVRRKDGPGFEIIKKPRNPFDKRSPIQELPNEILTHALAHLTPTDLASVSSVSKRFHDLVTGPHAWRTAFSHYFLGPDSINADSLDDDAQAVVRSEKRAFTRLTALASWRSEYIMRTRLLRSLGRGKPVQAPSPPPPARSGQVVSTTPIVMYNSQLFTAINHLHATFGTGLNKRCPRFIHGADDIGTATSSDPAAVKVDSWGLSDPQFFLQFSERFPGDAQYGLGPGEVIGVPNVMDVSQPYGMVVGEGSPGGMTYHRSTDEMRGRFLSFSSAMSAPEIGIPKITSSTEAVTSVWIAKSPAIPSLTEGLIGILSGSSLGVLTAYSLGSTSATNKNGDQRFGRGEITSRWVLSPGVPLIAIAVDNDYSLKRHAQNRIWAVVLNALGEVFFLTKFPKRPHVERGTPLDDDSLERAAWLTGRTIYWTAVEPSRRVAKVDPYAHSSVDGSYSPRSSWNGMCLSKNQIQAETREIENFATRKPKDFQKICAGWDMRRRLEVDFAGDDGNNAGEHVAVIDCGLEEDSVSAVKRYSRCRVQEGGSAEVASASPLTTGSSQSASPPSLFGGSSSPILVPAPDFSFDRLEDSLARNDFTGSITPRPMKEEWRMSEFSLGGVKHVQIMATTIDNSTFATQTLSEDPLLGFPSRSAASSPSLTPLSAAEISVGPADVPGQRARLFAVGTKLGAVLVWNIRGSVSRSTETTNSLDPVRIVYTDSPQISCLALSSLYLVHGGNDGLVQAWDPLASDVQPIRTLNSKYSSRARRRLVQAQASAQGVGINMYAAGALCLDPDPTVLRGMVSLGNQLRYWSYSSSAADQYKSHKRRLRRSERSSNNGGERFLGATRSNLRDYIANEQLELDREKQQREKDAQRFAGRFGTELLDGSEEEMIAYAAMLSQETLKQESKRRASDTSTATSTAASSTDQSQWATADPTPAETPPERQAHSKTDEELDADIEEAIRQSLATSPSGAYEIPIRQAKAKGKGRNFASSKASPRISPYLAGSSKEAEMLSDMEFALQLSLAEEQSRMAVCEDGEDEELEWKGKGKGKGKAW